LIDDLALLLQQIKTAQAWPGQGISVTSFGSSSKLMPVPYVTVTPAPGVNDGEAFQLWAHFPIGRDRELRSFIRTELPDAVRMLKESFTGKVLFPRIGNFDGAAVDQNDNTLRAGITLYKPCAKNKAGM
jgi:hypothetical protein